MITLIFRIIKRNNILLIKMIINKMNYLIILTKILLVYWKYLLTILKI